MLTQFLFGMLGRQQGKNDAMPSMPLFIVIMVSSVLPFPVEKKQTTQLAPYKHTLCHCEARPNSCPCPAPPPSTTMNNEDAHRVHFATNSQNNNDNNDVPVSRYSSPCAHRRRSTLIDCYDCLEGRSIF